MRTFFLLFVILCLCCLNTGCSKKDLGSKNTDGGVSSGGFAEGLIAPKSSSTGSISQKEESIKPEEKVISQEKNQVKEDTKSGEQLEQAPTNDIKNSSGEKIKDIIDQHIVLSENDTDTNLFSIEVCNKIIRFYQCIISKAPIENQPVMTESLEQVIEPWKSLADYDLQKICQNVVNQESFQEVAQHYQKQKCDLK